MAWRRQWSALASDLQMLPNLHCEAAGLGLVQPGGEEALEAPNSVPYPCPSPAPPIYWRSLRRWSHGLHNGAWWEDKKQQAQVETKDAHTGFEEIPFHREDGGVLA